MALRRPVSVLVNGIDGHGRNFDGFMIGRQFQSSYHFKLGNHSKSFDFQAEYMIYELISSSLFFTSFRNSFPFSGLSLQISCSMGMF